ncbi:MAG: baseplate J/gp47 family protein [Oscillospiraceae bacterium]|nr:baseplate J/gp47 family protein [Oscillospiraceae bacterium]
MAEWGFNQILSRMLAAVPDDVDKREGSIIYDALAPAALMMAEQYFMLKQLADMFFADTAKGEWLDRVAANFGLVRESATKAVRKLQCYNAEGALIDAAIGTRFSVNGTVFTVFEKSEDGSCKVICEQAGTVGNGYSGAILPLDSVSGLAKAVLDSEALLPARDTETDEQLRARLYDSVRSTPFGGNRADCIQKATAIEGVGSCAAFTASEGMGEGNVGLVISDDEGSPASEQLIQKVTELFCGDGNGNGLAPIGHNVTVNGCEWLYIEVSAALKIKEGASLEVVQPFAQQAAEQYIAAIQFGDSVLFTARMMSALLTCHEAVLDVTELTVNGSAANLQLSKSFECWQLPRLEAMNVTLG